MSWADFNVFLNILVLTPVLFLQNNPEAHENFLKINRAYEVLKDEDLRKKYDKYGEKGLEDHQEGGRYESWHFYRYDFGKMFSCRWNWIVTYFLWLICLKTNKQQPSKENIGPNFHTKRCRRI